ncbi:hypothetical protein EUTSA_v10009994mg [Eutrema salsugineum]|uniref:Uncharacterized protein n=1 Tax=Eutrema salsugineum TaxID=72664 RepID=V4KWI3_EUTSA|nr:RNA-binding protein NOB1 [Eutrema salsugineum]ESQ35709.1 hypothetical protein EUTSA_v10009994mg [Eutrema salsugineum]
MDSNPSSLWSSIVKKNPPSKPLASDGAPAAIPGIFGNCKSTKGISTAVLDANAVIEGGQSLTNLADRLVTVPEVFSEIRGKASRSLLASILFKTETRELCPESLSKVENFARATGDLQTLSEVDLKLIALTYTLEAQVHGTKNLRDVPPPIQYVKVNGLPEKESHRWGSNVETEDEQEGDRKHRRYPPKKTEVKLEGKMVVEGIDASQGEYDDKDTGDWKPAVSRSTHRKFLRRKAKREHNKALAEQEIQRDQEADKSGNMIVEATLIDGEDDIDHEGVDVANHELGEDMEMASEASSVADDGSSEQSWSLRDLTESSVACITNDFAMQNVILQMGLRFLAPGGMQIRQLNRWILRCHACNTVTPEVRKCHDCLDIRERFCFKCGNGGTLRKVAVTIGENGTIIAARTPRITLRGTKFSIPMPKGGRDAITKNLVLREDQLPEKFLHPKTKKKASKPGDEFFVSDAVFMNHHSDKKAPLQPPIREAMAVFSQKRNPNDNHYSRSRH